MTDIHDEKTKKELGTKLRSLREAKKLTQEELASKAGIHTNYISRIERGEENPTMEIFHKLAKALGVPSSDILPF